MSSTRPKQLVRQPVLYSLLYLKQKFASSAKKKQLQKKQIKKKQIKKKQIKKKQIFATSYHTPTVQFLKQLQYVKTSEEAN